MPCSRTEVGRRQLGWRAVRLQKKLWESSPMKAGQQQGGLGVRAVTAGGLCGMATISSVSEGPGGCAVNLRALDFDGSVSALPLRLDFLIIEKPQRMPRGY